MPKACAPPSPCGQLGKLRDLLDTRTGAARVSDSQGVTPLMLAARGGQAQMVNLLLERDSDIHATSAHGCTAFSIACEEGFVRLARAIVSKGTSSIHPSERERAVQVPLRRL